MLTSYITTEWIYEDKLPECLDDADYDELYPQSEVRFGVRMFPYREVFRIVFLKRLAAHIIGELKLYEGEKNAEKNDMLDV